jgi:hypothetical protein
VGVEWEVTCDWASRGAGCYPKGSDHAIQKKVMKKFFLPRGWKTGDEKSFCDHVVWKTGDEKFLLPSG